MTLKKTEEDLFHIAAEAFGKTYSERLSTTAPKDEASYEFARWREEAEIASNRAGTRAVYEAGYSDGASAESTIRHNAEAELVRLERYVRRLREIANAHPGGQLEHALEQARKAVP